MVDTERRKAVLIRRLTSAIARIGVLLLLVWATPLGVRAAVLSELSVVEAVDEAGGAAEAGLRAGDRVIRFNDVSAPTLLQLSDDFRAWSAARSTKMVVEREGREVRIELRQGPWKCRFRPDLTEGLVELMGQIRRSLGSDDAESAEAAFNRLRKTLVGAQRPDFVDWLDWWYLATLVDFGSYSRAIEHFEKRRSGSLAPAATLGGWAIHDLVAVHKAYWRESAAGRAEECLSEAEALAEAQGNKALWASVAYEQAMLLYKRGRVDAAEGILKRCLSYWQEVAPEPGSPRWKSQPRLASILKDMVTQ